jgi:hypothetical protein
MESKSKRGLGAKKCVRINISITTDIHKKLKRLSISCDMPPATLASLILEHEIGRAHV